ncbi:MAG TPA: four helix bundle protein [Candidatus Paceibacterota bacterium]|nr:four helix bundle protein [Candidatus Paceibacterota bacterium]
MKEFDLEKRTFLFAQAIRTFIKELPKTITSFEDAKQLVRSSGSVGANYIEANEALSKKDFLMRIKICRKEAKESIYWLQLIEIPEHLLEKKKQLIAECTELLKIFSAIVSKSS